MTYLYKIKKRRSELETPGRYSRPTSGASIYSTTSFRSTIDSDRRIKRGKRWGTTAETSHTTYNSDGRRSYNKRSSSNNDDRNASRQSTSRRPARPPSVTSMMLQDMSWNAMIELMEPKKRDMEILRVYVGNGRNFTLPLEHVKDNRPKSTKSTKTVWTRNQRMSQKQADVYKDISNIYNHSMAREKREKEFLHKYADRRANMMKDLALQRHKEDCKRIEKKIKVYEEVKKVRMDFAQEKHLRSKAQFVSSKLLEHEKPRGRHPPVYAVPDIISADTRRPPMRRPRRPDLAVDKDKLKEIGRNTHVIYFDPYVASNKQTRAPYRPKQPVTLKPIERKTTGTRRNSIQSVNKKPENPEKKVKVHSPTPPTEPKQEVTKEADDKEQSKSKEPERSESKASYTIIVAEKLTIPREEKEKKPKKEKVHKEKVSVPSAAKREGQERKGLHVYV
ncbi:hypothetical protein FSP39_006421 [Pinctada imbricata]|uniref:Uncharacterized protein n=1 Tax=Pinctada imbricata TaxID=66713 RepID=A0AA88XZG4_PINIB|nr:hypothetical protein FSP39_006421 [Pinctada imbricata]